MPPSNSAASPARPKRGEIWYVDMDPSRGREIQKIRPCIVLSLDTVGRLPLRFVVPLTGWQPSFASASWIVRVDAETGTGMDKTSGADLLQARGVDLERFSIRGPIGEISDEVLQQIVEALAFMVGYQPETEIG